MTGRVLPFRREADVAGPASDAAGDRPPPFLRTWPLGLAAAGLFTLCAGAALTSGFAPPLLADPAGQPALAVGAAILQALAAL